MGGGRSSVPVPVDRASPADLMQLATDVGPAPMHVGAVLVLGTGPGFTSDTFSNLFCKTPFRGCIRTAGLRVLILRYAAGAVTHGDVEPGVVGPEARCPQHRGDLPAGQV